MKFRFLFEATPQQRIDYTGNMNWKSMNDEEKLLAIRTKYILSPGVPQKNVLGSAYNDERAKPNGVLLPFAMKSFDLYGNDDRKNKFYQYTKLLKVELPKDSNIDTKIKYIWEKINDIDFSNPKKLDWLLNHSELYTRDYKDFQYTFNIFNTLTFGDISRFDLDKDKVDINKLYDGGKIREAGLNDKQNPDSIWYVVDSWSEESLEKFSLSQLLDEYDKKEIKDYIISNNDKISQSLKLKQNLTNDNISNIVDFAYSNIGKLKNLKVSDDLLDISLAVVRYYINSNKKVNLNKALGNYRTIQLIKYISNNIRGLNDSIKNQGKLKSSDIEKIVTYAFGNINKLSSIQVSNNQKAICIGIIDYYYDNVSK